MTKFFAILLLFLHPFRNVSGIETVIASHTEKEFHIHPDKDGTSPAELQRLITLLVKTTPQKLFHTCVNRFILLSSEKTYPDRNHTKTSDNSSCALHIRYLVLRL